MPEANSSNPNSSKPMTTNLFQSYHACGFEELGFHELANSSSSSIPEGLISQDLAKSSHLRTPEGLKS